jgi:transcriptional regulator with XRE-family HTH domain
MLSPVVTRERRRDRGRRRARTTLGQLGRELRDARRGLGQRQRDLAIGAGVSASWVSRIERGEVDEVGYRLLCVLFTLVGLDLSSRVFPGGTPLRDEAHRQLLARFRERLPAGTPWRTEVPLSRPPDQRAWDAVVQLWGRRVGVEAEVQLTDLQALERRLQLKARDGEVDRLILLVGDTRRNRDLLREVASGLRGSFPLQGRAALAALRDLSDPGCDLLVLV